MHARGRAFDYDALVLATGSSASVPPVPGADLPGCFVYRTVDDVAELRAWVTDRERTLSRPVRGAVVGGGLLGLEAAGALHGDGRRDHGRRVRAAADAAAGRRGRRRGPAPADRGARRHGAHRRPRPSGSRPAATAGWPGWTSPTATSRLRRSTSWSSSPPASGPRDELARERRPRRSASAAASSSTTPARPPYPTSTRSARSPASRAAPGAWSAPGYTMAEVVVDRLLGGEATFPGADISTKLKLLGVDVASFGDAFAAEPGSLEVVYADPVAGVYKKLVRQRRRPDPARRRARRRRLARTHRCARWSAAPLGADPTAWLLPEGTAPADRRRPARRGRTSARATTSPPARSAAPSTEHGCTDLAGVKACTKAGTSCGSCLPLVKKLMNTELEKAGVEVSNALCEHFARQPGRSCSTSSGSPGCATFSEIIDEHGTRPRLRHLPPGGRLDPGLARHGPRARRRAGARCRTPTTTSMANLQKDGTYSVVPRIPGGEVTPEGLIAIGQVAEDFGLYTKITGGQRIDLFGARIEQLPAIWQRLVDAGFESGHAYGKALRTVKSCVGHDLVPLRRAGLRRRSRSPWSCATAACGRRTRSSSASPAAPGSAPRRAARTSASSPPRRAGTCTSAATAASRRGTRSCSPRTSTPRRWSGPSTAS